MAYPLPHCSDVVFNYCLARSAEGFAKPTILQDLEINARYIRMTEIFAPPHRSARVSHAKKITNTSLRVTYKEAGA